ncbi:hypothetical protein CHS0354_023983 [Potamilus streckersoni]|uniref:Cytochrome c oxidase subunit 1 n=1 Tax=Potamilus streckersoni TaxID=2493646 RepID=A0AAE0VMM6_9BIVA|nr:hypothetical protein CHS0354_023983 [Potamilus streckersoni]
METYELPQASRIAEDVDAAFMFITIVSTIIFIGTTVISVYFAWKYRQQNNKAKFTTSLDGNPTLEIVWTAIPVILLVIVFFWGFRSFLDGKITPPNAMEIKVTGKKWFWTFDYPNGANSVNELIIPEGQPIKALLSSTDVIHSFYIPAFRTKMDAIPNRYTILNFTPTMKGTFDVFCAEYCGTSHSEMLGKVKVVSNSEYAAWVESANEGGNLPPAELGEKLYKEKACVTCHSIDGTTSTGPSWKGLFGSQRQFLDGSNAVADEDYLKTSIVNPNEKVLSGFQSVMPSYSATTAAFILGFSSIFTGLNFIVTIHKLRAPGMTWFKMPLFIWGMYATAIIQVLATPVIGITLFLLIIERILGIGIFDPAMGGDPVLYQHFFWFYSHPAVYIMILPGMAITSDLIGTFSQKRIFGYKMIAFSSIGLAFVSFLVWGHHMFTSGQSELASLIFSALTFLVGIPSGIKVFNWVATMYKGNVRMDSPMLYAHMFLSLFTIGGLTGIYLPVLSVDIHLHDTYFIVAHFHYVMMGSTMIAFFGGIHYWWSKMFGRMYNEFLAKISAVLIFVGFNVTFFPQFIMGMHGMPRRYYTYLEQYQSMHVLSTIGSWILLVGFLLMAGYLIHSLIKGSPAPPNPWRGLTLEWTTQSPILHENFLKQPEALWGPYDYDRVMMDEFGNATFNPNPEPRHDEVKTKKDTSKTYRQRLIEENEKNTSE